MKILLELNQKQAAAVREMVAFGLCGRDEKDVAMRALDDAIINFTITAMTTKLSQEDDESRESWRGE